MNQTLSIFLLLAVGALADDVFGRSRKLQQLCHPERGGGIAAPGIGGFFTHPEIGGVKVDFCLRPNTGCGKQAADAFCKNKGLAFSDSYVAWTFAGSACGSTVYLGNKKACTGSGCTGFRVISCAGNLVPDILETIIGTPQEAPVKAPAPQEVSQEKPPEPAESVPPESVSEEAPVPGDVKPISQTLDVGGSEAPVEPNTPDQSSPAGVEAKKNQDDEPGTETDTSSTLVSPQSADGSGEGSEEDSIPENPLESDVSVPAPQKDVPASDSSADKSEESPAPQDSGNAKTDTNAENPQPPPAAAQALGGNETPSDSATKQPDDGVVIDHPDLGNVVLPGQENPADTPAQSSTEGSDTDQANPPSNPANDQDALFCQERGAQSASAAARSGCGSVISQCASDESITKSQENLGGVAGRRLFQSLVDSTSCRKLFADECQAAAFDNATGICATLMGSGPNPGEERPGCATAEEAREIFKSVVKDSCAIFMAGAFP